MNSFILDTILILELVVDSFRSHKMRTFLAILGVTVGISSIIIVFSTGEGVKGLMVSEMETFGTDVIQAELKIPSSKKGVAGETQSAIGLLQGAQVTTMTLDDLDDVLKLPNVRDGYGMLMTQERVTYRDELHNSLIWATGASFIDIDKTGLAQGRYFSHSEDRSLAQVVVLGNGIKKKLFGDMDPLDKTIKIRDTRFRVIGVIKERGAMMSFDFDNMIYLPVQTMQKKVMGIDYIMSFFARLHDMSISEQTNEEIRTVLRENHNIDPPEEIRESMFDTGKDDFRVVTMVEALEIFDDMLVVLTILLLAIVAISLVVGGVGVMNMMYVIVNERTPEIGLRKAVGAKYNDIMLQFLIESVAITMAGGIVGTIMGVLISFLVALGAGAAGYDWGFYIPPAAFVTAFLFSLVFGVIFGVYPARKAALLHPIDAMRHE